MSTKSYFDRLEKKFGRLSFGRLLKALRDSEGMTLAEFAKKLDISIQNLCDLEKGRRIPSPLRTARIARKLGYPVDSLIELSIRDSLENDGLYFEVKLSKAS